MTGRSGGLGFFSTNPSHESIATVVVTSLWRGAELGHYQLGAFAIMANHVHVLLLPRVPPSRLLKSLKGYTAYQANRLLGRTGEPFWQRESYNHWVRSQEEWQRIAAYTENNPVKAGVVSQAEEYRWASAHATWRAKLAPAKRRHECRRGTQKCVRHGHRLKLALMGRQPAADCQPASCY